MFSLERYEEQLKKSIISRFLTHFVMFLSALIFGRKFFMDSADIFRFAFDEIHFEAITILLLYFHKPKIIRHSKSHWSLMCFIINTIIKYNEVKVIYTKLNWSMRTKNIFRTKRTIFIKFDTWKLKKMQ